MLTTRTRLTMTTTPIPGLTPTYEDYSRCVHCGLCLNACPTYRLWNLEADSPRGRIRQMVSVEPSAIADPEQKAFPITASFVDHIDKCLDCRACETACPSGVHYGILVEYARARIERDYRRPFFSRLQRNLVFRHLLPYPKRIAAAAQVLRVYQRSGLQKLARGTGLLGLLGLAGREALLPPIDGKFFFDQLGTTHPAGGPRRARVAFFAGCVAQVTFTPLNEATIRVLTANGCEVVVPTDQRCCGALAAHAGAREAARAVARRNLLAFDLTDFDAIVTNAAGCGSTLKEYGELLEGDPRAQKFAALVKDVNEFLASIELNPRLGEIRATVTYQDSCHLAHGQKIRSAPRQLLARIPGLKLKEMRTPDACCGSAGIYNVLHTDLSMSLLEKKMEAIQATGADRIVTANPGCMLQLRVGVDRWGRGQRVSHVVEILDEAYQLRDVVDP